MSLSHATLFCMGLLDDNVPAASTPIEDLLDRAFKALYAVDADSLDPPDAITYASAVANVASAYALDALARSAPTPGHSERMLEIASNQLGHIIRIADSVDESPAKPQATPAF